MRSSGGRASSRLVGGAIVAVFGALSPTRTIRESRRSRARDLEDVRRREPVSPTDRDQLGLVVAVLVGDGSQSGVIGVAVNVAAPLQQAASPGRSSSQPRPGVMCDAFSTEPLGALGVKGKAEAVETFRVLGPRQAEEARRRPLRRHEEELALLELLGRARRGKARRLDHRRAGSREVATAGRARTSVRRLRRPRRMRRGRAYVPFLDITDHILAAPENVDDLEGRAAGVVSPWAPPSSRAASRLRGTPPVYHGGERGRPGVRRFLAASRRDMAAARRTLALDDVRWVDDRHGGFSPFCALSSPAAAMLILLYRPGFPPPRPGAGCRPFGVRLEPL